MAVNEIGEVQKLEDGDVIIHSPDGKDSEIVSKMAVNAIAESLQSDCKGIAERLQSDCKAPATPTISTCRPKPLAEKARYSEIENLLNNPKYIKEISAGIFPNIQKILDTQKGLPYYIIDDLNRKGFQINDAEIRRDFLPLYRLKRKDKTIANQRIINIILTITLSITLVLYFSKNQVTNSPIQTEQTAITTNKDSVMTYEELHLYITEYCKLKRIQIYPYSEQIILQRINEKGINDIESIKNEIEYRFNEIKKR